MKTIISMILTSIMIISCEQKEKKEPPNFTSWKGSIEADKTKRKKDNHIIELERIFSCRRIQPYHENVHYYYSLTANTSPEKVIVNETSHIKETYYSDAEFNIEHYTATPNGGSSLLKSIFFTNVDFKIADSADEKGEKIATVIANTQTLERIREYYANNPYFSHLQVGDEIMSIRVSTYGQFSPFKINGTKKDLPGAIQGDTLECR